MQQSQRAACNHALQYAVRRADELELPVVVGFGITQRYPEANERHYAFMLEGLRETEKALAERGIQLVVRKQPPVDAALELADDAAEVIADRGYLRFQKVWRRRVAERAGRRVVQVESDVVVPVETTSGKEEYAARTIRPRIHEQLDGFLVPLEETDPSRDSLDMELDGADLADVSSLLGELRLNRDTTPAPHFRGGTAEAERLLAEFIKSKLERYADGRNEPAADCVSHMSPYLHFGQISPLRVALAVDEAPGKGADNVEAYLEELIVRRELSMNYCHHCTDYDSLDGLPDWAQDTLADHADDRRKHTYTMDQLERADTHDPWWNAAQREMVLRGKMHNYMRMYWGKKILEWVPDPREAFRVALTLNNRYELDGRDGNSFTGVAWCFGKHDRAWAERPVFGKVRYMSAAGLERKFDMEAYVRRVEELEDGEGEST
jgi:deoxyribodipyrimidine photo-lyase